jgi:hypothetical protein
MSKKHLFHLLVALALLIVATFAVRDAVAGTNRRPQRDASGADVAVACSHLPSQYSIHTEIVKATGTRVIVTEDGPTGLDGGFMGLMTAYRTCSR